MVSLYRVRLDVTPGSGNPGQGNPLTISCVSSRGGYPVTDVTYLLPSPLGTPKVPHSYGPPLCYPPGIHIFSIGTGSG